MGPITLSIPLRRKNWLVTAGVLCLTLVVVSISVRISAKRYIPKKSQIDGLCVIVNLTGLGSGPAKSLFASGTLMQMP